VADSDDDAEIKDPGTSAERLAQLTTSRPDLHAEIARHPRAYPDLLLWIAGNGEAESRSVAMRMLIESPPPPPAPGAPKVADGPVPPAPTATQTPSTSDRPSKRGDGRRGRPKLAIALSIAAVVAVTAALFAPRLLTNDEIQVAELSDLPVSGSWSLSGPADVPFGTAATVRGGFTASQDEAIVLWRVLAADGSESAWISLVETAAGNERWATKIDLPVADVTQATDVRGSGYAVVRVNLTDGSPILLGVDLATGQYTATPGLEPLGAPQSLEGDVIVRELATNLIHRWDVSTMSPVWSVLVEGEAPPRVLGSSLFLGARVINVEDGSDRGWSPDPTVAYSDAAGHVLAQLPSGELTAIGVVEESTGSYRWESELPADTRAIPIPGTNLLAASSAMNDETLVVDLNDGKRLWAAGGISPEHRALIGSQTANVVIMPIGGDGTSATAFDLTSGAALYDLAMSGAGLWQTLIGATPRTLYLAGGPASDLQAIDAADGPVRWALANPAGTSYAFAAWGGNIVAFRPGQAPSEGGPYPALLGVQ